MSRMIEITTPEHVVIHFELAGIGSRGVAAAIDVMYQFLAYLLLLLAGLGIPMLRGFLPWEEMDQAIFIALLILGYFIILWGYYVLFETLWNGETPGKRRMKLRVIKDGGFPVDFRAVLIRNLLRAVDCLPGVPGLPFYGLGFCVTLFHPRYQRLGDLAAGTLVVCYGEEAEDVRRPLLGDVQVFRLLDDAIFSRLSRLSRDEYRMVQQFLARRPDMPRTMQDQFARALAARLMAKLDYTPPTLGMDEMRWLEEIDLAYRRRLLDAPIIPSTIPEPVTAPAEDPTSRKW